MPSPTTNNLDVIYGGGSFASFASNNGLTGESVAEVLRFLHEHGITRIDTGQAYAGSEEMLGKAKAGELGFEIDTKVAGGLYKDVRHTKDVVIKAGEESIEKLGVDQVDVYYIHAPDRHTPLEDTLSGINALHKAGKFKRFGLSNFRPDEVLEVIRIAKENNFVLPSVYQGNYSAAGRACEKELLPILRAHKIAFFAYSPIAGGFLTKKPEDISANGKGRFNKDNIMGNLYLTLYNTPAKLEFLAEFGRIAEQNGVSQGELAFRWVAYHSELKPENGDAIIIGSKYGAQLTNTLEWLGKGPLSEGVAQAVNQLTKIIEGEEILDNWNDYISKNQ